MTALALLMIGVGYLAGSISSAILVCRICSLPDPRQVGSRNPGATNVYRIGGRFPALTVLLCDVLKGVLPVYGSYFLGLPPVTLGLIAIATCLGHSYPLYFGFIGGKSVATAFGTLLPIGPVLAGCLVATWGLVVFFSGFASLGALVAVSLAPIFTWLIKPEYTLPVIMLAIFIIFRHRENIARLLKGKEPTVWSKRRQ